MRVLPLAMLMLTAGLAGQQPETQSLIHPPRPIPVLPMVLVPFQLGTELCPGDNLPVVSLRVYNVLAQPVAVLRLRNTRGELVEGLRLTCGAYVARWDGTIDSGARIAPPGIYYLHLVADGRRKTLQLIVPQT
jgi:hypothetical protein